MSCTTTLPTRLATTSAHCQLGELLSNRLQSHAYANDLLYARSTMVHVEADHKKRTLKDDNGNYTEQTLNLMSTPARRSILPELTGLLRLQRTLRS